MVCGLRPDAAASVCGCSGGRATHSGQECEQVEVRRVFKPDAAKPRDRADSVDRPLLQCGPRADERFADDGEADDESSGAIDAVCGGSFRLGEVAAEYYAG